MKKCPYCAEVIQDDAIFCRYCKNDLTSPLKTSSNTRSFKNRAIAYYILGGILHIWTIIIAFLLNGLIAAVITFFFPILSTIYWFFLSGSEIGYFTLYHLFSVFVGILLASIVLESE